MSRLVSAAAIVVASAAAGSAGAEAAGTPSAKQPPRAAIALASVQPLKLKGTRFRARERVRVTIQGSGQSTTRELRASRAGSFVVAFPGADTCNGLSVRAAGDRGSRASFQFSSLLCPDS